jgi:hypothetical protein
MPYKLNRYTVMYRAKLAATAVVAMLSADERKSGKWQAKLSFRVLR